MRWYIKTGSIMRMITIKMSMDAVNSKIAAWACSVVEVVGLGDENWPVAAECLPCQTT